MVSMVLRTRTASLAVEVEEQHLGLLLVAQLFELWDEVRLARGELDHAVLVVVGLGREVVEHLVLSPAASVV